jgi:dTDP-4-dehydrorhamnose reductase
MILLLGANGMLGRYANSYLSQYYSVKCLTRDDFDFFVSAACIEQKLSSILTPGDIVINCIGIIKPQVNKVGIPQTIFINSVLPHILSDWCEKNQVKMIHATTDCVFSGLHGKYTLSSIHDDNDIYGRSKSLGEPHNASCIRVSIIGEEKFSSRSLVEWIKSMKHQNVNGFTNHFWNGITCLEWSKFVHYVISKNDFWSGTIHLKSPETVSKAELVEMISDIYELNININKIESSFFCDRTLHSDFKNYEIKSLREQILEMKNWKL